MQNSAICLLGLKLSLIVQFVSLRNHYEISSLNVKMLLCKMLSLAQKNFNLDTSSKFIFEIMSR